MLVRNFLIAAINQILPGTAFVFVVLRSKTDNGQPSSSVNNCRQIFRNAVGLDYPGPQLPDSNFCIPSSSRRDRNSALSRWVSVTDKAHLGVFLKTVPIEA